jgi:hypothetical protein
LSRGALADEDVSVLLTRTSVINSRRVVTGRDGPADEHSPSVRAQAQPAPLRGARHRHCEEEREK